MHVVHTPHPSSEGAIAVCGALQELRATNIAAVRAIFLWKNKLGDRGAAAVAALVQQSAIPGFERLWVAEVHLSHNNITVHGAQELFAAAHRYPRNANTGLVPLWLRLEHNGIGEYLCVCVQLFWCVCVHAAVALWCGVLRCVARAIESRCIHACISHVRFRSSYHAPINCPMYRPIGDGVAAPLPSREPWRSKSRSAADSERRPLRREPVLPGFSALAPSASG